jgi:hypothetical protein
MMVVPIEVSKRGALPVDPDMSRHVPWYQSALPMLGIRSGDGLCTSHAFLVGEGGQKGALPLLDVFAGLAEPPQAPA